MENGIPLDVRNSYRDALKNMDPIQREGARLVKDAMVIPPGTQKNIAIANLLSFLKAQKESQNKGIV